MVPQERATLVRPLKWVVGVHSATGKLCGPRRLQQEGYSRYSREMVAPYETATTRTVASSSKSPAQNSVTRSSKNRCSASADS